MPKLPLEKKLQEKIISEIRLRFGRDVWLYKTHDQCQVGIPDLIICLKGRFVAIEIKRPGCKLPAMTKKTLQKYTLENINNADGYAFMSNDFDEIMKNLNIIYHQQIEMKWKGGEKNG